MDPEEIKKLIDGDPDTLIKRAGELGIDFSDMGRSLARGMVTGKFSLTDEQFETIDFVFWISYFVERAAEEFITFPEVSVGARKEAMDVLIGKLHFGDKIKVIEELYMGKKDKLIILMRKIQDLRNDIAHGRFDKLDYGGYSLSDNRGKLKLVANLRDALLKK
ncbi:MAG: hypothetical protein QG633_366 [Patescibacteria group bacterium]|jgi:hypothetical protein|nr:hypothetical protein [Patescibacteria group bacterium]